MRLKKGFTLAEILIVLMVIGVIATMTVPSMMRGVQEAQLKTAYKKAYNTISNFASVERVAGQLPSRASALATAQLMQSLNNTLSVNTYAQQAINAGVALQNAAFRPCVTLAEGVGTIGEEISGAQCLTHTVQEADEANAAPTGNATWIITEDNIAYTILTGGASGATDTCASKLALASQTTLAGVINNSCAVVVVDVNGLSKGPNLIETQTQDVIANGTSMETIQGDQFQIYVGVDGASAGPKANTITGRIVADLK